MVLKKRSVPDNLDYKEIGKRNLEITRVRIKGMMSW